MERTKARFIKRFMDYNVGKVEDMSKEHFDMLNANGYVEEYVDPILRKNVIIEKLSIRFDEIIKSLKNKGYDYVESLLTMQDSGYDCTVQFINLKDILEKESNEYDYDMSVLIEVLKKLDEED